jgi:hypothetical protein
MDTTRIIEQYLDGTLDYEEKRKLEERTLLDNDLRELIRLHKEVNESIRDADLSEFQVLLKKVNAVYFQTVNFSSPIKGRNPAKMWQNKFIRFAAILVIIAGAGVILKYSLFRGVNTEKLYHQYYSAYDADVVSRSVQTDKVALDSAIISYCRNNYTEALSKLNIITAYDQKNYLAWFYQGLTCLETNATAEAIQSFNTIPVLWSSPYNEHRNWYLALALLHNGETAKATEAFNNISASGGYYADIADKILQQIKP